MFNGPRDYLVGPSPDSVVVADFNGDGRADIATASQSSATVSVLLRNSDGTFQPGVNNAAGNSPNSMRPLYVADVNNDGKPDLLVLNTTDQTLSVLLGNGDGTFQTQKVTTIAGSYCCLAVGDFNGDGKIDIATPVLGAVVGTYGFAVLLGKGDGTFQAPVSYPSAELFALTAADLTNNGKLDLVTDSSVMLGSGNGTFQSPIKTPLPTVSGLSILIADFNQDGNLDIATSTGNFMALMLGNGDGTFREQVLTVPATPLALGDWNGDGIPDLIAEGTGVLVGNGLESLLNLGDGTFTVWQYSLALAGGYSLGQIPMALSAFTTEPNPYLVLATASGGELYSETAGIASVLNGNGDGTFATFPLPYPAYPSTQIQTSLGPLIAVDFNGDGKPDLLTDQTLGNGHGESGGQLGLLLNTGAGFSAATLVPLQQCCSLGLGDGDFNGDGHLDLAVGDSDIAVFLGNGNGTFQPPADYGAGLGNGPVAVGDFNYDGKLDVLGANYNGVAVLLGNGDGTFSLPVNSAAGASAYSFAVADFNHDGKLDVAVLDPVGETSESQLAVLLGNGDGTFSQASAYAFPFQPTVIAVGDLNGDGIPDLVVGVSAGTNLTAFVPASVEVLLGNGDGTFQPPVTTTAGNEITSIAVADFNGDGKLDVALSNLGWNDVSLLLGNGNGTFQSPMQFSSGLVSIGVGPSGALAVADFDGNGSPDLAVVEANGVTILLSAGKNGSGALLAPAAIAFGNQNVGQTSAAQTSILTNTSSAVLNITSIAISGPQSGDYEQTNTCGTSIGAGINCAITVTFSPQGTGVRTAVIQITDGASNSPQMIGLSGTGIIAPNFTISMPTGGGSSTISAGGTATFNLTLSPAGSFSGMVNFACSISPAITPAPVCGVPASVNVTGISATPVTVTISTTAAGSSTGGPFIFSPPATWLIEWTLFLGALSLLFVGKRRRVFYLPLMVLVFLMPACGGGNSSSTPPPSTTSKGTPAGTYTASITATSGSLSHQVTLTVIVQ